MQQKQPPTVIPTIVATGIAMDDGADPLDQSTASPPLTGAPCVPDVEGVGTVEDVIELEKNPVCEAMRL